MTQRKHPKSQAKRDVKASVGKNGQASDSADTSSSGPGSGPPSGASSGPGSCFSLVLVLALIGLWSSMAVVYFDVVDYESVLARAKELRLNFTHVLQGRLLAYDTDADGDFDLDDAKVLLGLNKDGGRSDVVDGDEKTDSRLEEVISLLSEEGSDWLFGFFSFLVDLTTQPITTEQNPQEPIKAEQDDS